MNRAVLYTTVSTCGQNPQTQALELRRLAEQRGFEIVHEYTDRISGAKAKRPALDQVMATAHRREFDVVMVWAADRLAPSVRHSLVEPGAARKGLQDFTNHRSKDIEASPRALYRRPRFLLPQPSIENMPQKREHRAS